LDVVSNNSQWKEYTETSLFKKQLYTNSEDSDRKELGIRLHVAGKMPDDEMNAGWFVGTTVKPIVKNGFHFQQEFNYWEAPEKGYMRDVIRALKLGVNV